jgi:putative copper export protein
MYQISLILHVLAAGVWAGGHLILSIIYLPRALKEKNFEIIRQYEVRYEKIGIPALIILIATGLFQSFRLIPNFFDWFKHTYFVPINITLKLFLLIITLLLAHHARFRIIPKLSNENLTGLAVHIISVTVIAVLMVIVGVSFRFGGLF